MKANESKETQKFTITKRDGNKMPYDSTKIVNAIEKANATMDRESEKASPFDISAILELVEYRLTVGSKIGEDLSVEQIQDIVVHNLLNQGHEKLALSYEVYRATKAQIREMKEANSVDGMFKSITGLVSGTNSEVMRENSNKDASINSTQRDLIAGEVSKYFARKYMIPRNVVQAHEDGVLHFHDMDYFIQSMFNCFSKDVRFITSEGTLSFKDCYDGMELTVPTHTGEFKKAIVKSYGKQQLQMVTFQRGKNSKKTISCTKNHRWILANGDETTNLHVGDKILKAPICDDFEFESATDEAKYYWCLGFVIGDGNDFKNSETSFGCKLRLCNEKTTYARRFRACGFSANEIPSFNGDIHVVLPKMRKQEFLNNESWKVLNKECKIALINGLLAADGEFRKGIYPTGISTADERIRNLCLDLLETAGYYIGTERIDSNSTNFVENRILYHIQFARTQYEKQLWTVENIEKTDLTETVWCLEVEDNHSFILSGGIVTGNCCLINIKDMLDNGTVMNGYEIHSPNSFQTACTVMTQIVAAVASNQYGGQSIDIRHLGKYLRKTYDKAYRKYSREFPELDEETIKRMALSRQKEDMVNGVQTIQYQLNTLMTTNGQAPFVTIFLNLVKGDEYEKEVAMIIEEILKQRYEGIIDEHGVAITPAFPKLIGEIKGSEPINIGCV